MWQAERIRKETKHNLKFVPFFQKMQSEMSCVKNWMNPESVQKNKNDKLKGGKWNVNTYFNIWEHPVQALGHK